MTPHNNSEESTELRLGPPHHAILREKLTQAQFDNENQILAFYDWERQGKPIPGDEKGDWDRAQRRLEKIFVVEEPAA